MHKHLILQWKKEKRFVMEQESFWTWDMQKYTALESFFLLIQSYPSLYGKYYTEKGNSFDESYRFLKNSRLLCFMIFFRLKYPISILLGQSEYSQPRS